MNVAPTIITLRSAADVRNDVDALLRDYYQARITEAVALDSSYGSLWSSISELAFAGGKRLRPWLLATSYEMYGGEHYQAVLPIAAAAELLHLSLLIHDDITDKDTIRYGVENITGRYNKLYLAKGASAEDARHYAESAALLAGDLLLSAAHSMILQSPLPASQRVRAHELLSQSVYEVAAGQLLDMEAGMGGMSATDAFKIARYKTAGYSFIGPITCGAELASAPVGELKKLQTLGETLGLAFQLSDDLLGVFGDENRTGKSALTDLQEGKHTYLMQRAYSQATPEEIRQLDQYVGRHDLTEAQAGDIRDIIVKCGAKRQVEETLVDNRRQAVGQVEGLLISETAKRHLLELVDFVTKRDH